MLISDLEKLNTLTVQASEDEDDHAFCNIDEELTRIILEDYARDRIMGFAEQTAGLLLSKLNDGFISEKTANDMCDYLALLAERSREYCNNKDKLHDAMTNTGFILITPYEVFRVNSTNGESKCLS